MSDVIPFILSEEKRRIKDEITGKDVSVIFDGTSQLGEALAIVVLLVNSSAWCIEQRIVRMQLYSHEDALTTNERSISILDVRFPTSQTGTPQARSLVGKRGGSLEKNWDLKNFVEVTPSKSNAFTHGGLANTC